MKIIHLNTQDRTGGAGKAVYRLHKQLLDLGVDSKLLVSQLNYNDDSTVQEADTTFLSRIKRKYSKNIEDIPFKFYNYYREPEFSLNWVSQINLSNVKMLKEADIIGLYWIGRGFLNPAQIKKIQKPIVWRLSDMWPFTGGCHYSSNCTGYVNQCGVCPKIHSKNKADITHRLILNKINNWVNLDITVVAPSKWIAKCASESSVFKNHPIKVIHSGIDHNFFKPIEKSAAKECLNVNKEDKVLLFGAAYADTDVRKGFDLLLQILNYLDKNGVTLTLLVFGNTNKVVLPNFENLTVVFLNEIKSPYLLRLAYCAADIFVAPYREDNLPNTIIEAMSCKTPCIAFKVGGIPEIIDHKKNGYLAIPYDTKSFANGVIWILENQKRYALLSQNARKSVIEGKFTLEDQAKEYIELYKKIVGNVRQNLQ